MIFRSNRALFRIAAVAVLMSALGLGACGRKGPLDPPPNASVVEPAPVASAGPMRAAPMSGLAPAQAQEERSLFGDPALRNPGTAPVAPKGQKKRIPLDVLLD